MYIYILTPYTPAHINCRHHNEHIPLCIFGDTPLYIIQTYSIFSHPTHLLTGSADTTMSASLSVFLGIPSIYHLNRLLHPTQLHGDGHLLSQYLFVHIGIKIFIYIYIVTPYKAVPDVCVFRHTPLCIFYICRIYE